MFERFTPSARTVVAHAQQHSRRLGHRYIGCEHLLLAAVAADEPAGAVLREHGVTPDRVEEEIVRRIGLGPSASLFGGLDRDALAAVGIDLDAVRARIEATFGADALGHAAQAFQGGHRPSRLDPRRALPPRLVPSWPRRPRTRPPAPQTTAHAGRPPATGRYRAAGAPVQGHIPFTPAARKTLEISLRQAVARHDDHIGVEHIALALIHNERGVVPPILAALGTAGGTLRTAIEDRYRQAS